MTYSCCIGLCVNAFQFVLLLILSESEERAAVVGIENPAFNGEGSAALSNSPSWLGRKMRGDRPDSTLAAHQKKLELQAPASERGEASVFISLKSVDSRCVPDLTFLSLPPSFLFCSLSLALSLSLRSRGPWSWHSKASVSKQARSYNFFRWRSLCSSGCSISI